MEKYGKFKIKQQKNQHFKHENRIQKKLKLN